MISLCKGMGSGMKGKTPDERSSVDDNHNNYAEGRKPGINECIPYASSYTELPKTQYDL